MEMFLIPPIWTRRVNIISWAIFFLIMFLFQFVFLISQFSIERSTQNKKMDNRIPNEPRERNEVLNSTDLKLLLDEIIRNNLRPPDSAYNFNVSKSEEIPLDRDIIDTRPPACLTNSYSIPDGIKVSVIVIFHNEALSTLLRTVHSILHRSPANLLKEVILVDDLSTFGDLGEVLSIYVSSLDPRVRILRNKQRQGLVRSRLRGANNATGDILVWLDAHTECNTGWLEPLVHELTRHNQTIVQPHVDVIDSSTIDFYAYPGEMFRGGFGWDLRYSWFQLPKYLSQSLTSVTDPFPTPVLVGCIIAVRKDHFDSTGRFDDGLNIWGGEHFDLSFRTWLCGGRILTVTCSRVGHMFKENKYDFNGDRSTVIRKNLMRISDIWLDEYKWVFDAVSRAFGPAPVLTQAEIKSRMVRKALRRKLNCKPFKWFLDHIMPEIKVPSYSDDYFGELTNYKTALCWAPLEDGYIGITYECFKHRILPEIHFSLDFRGRLLHDHQCVYMDKHTLLLKKQPCECLTQSNRAVWSFRRTKDVAGQLVYEFDGRIWCPAHVTNIADVHYEEQMVQMHQCNYSDPYQTWSFTYNLVK